MLTPRAVEADVFWRDRARVRMWSGMPERRAPSDANGLFLFVEHWLSDLP